MFSRRGAWSLVFAKFVPGLSTLAPPLAGVTRMPFGRFLMLDGLGSLVWAVGFTGLGFVFSQQLERLITYSDQMQRSLPIVMLVGLALYVGWKYLQRRRFFAQLHADRITPEDLKAKLDAGESVVIVDLRHDLDLEQGMEVIPGALHIRVRENGELDHRAAEIPVDQDIVLYCS